VSIRIIGFIVGNTLRDNAQFGLRLSGSSAYRENLITSNTAGTVSTPAPGSFFNLGDNACTNDANLPVACP